MGVLKEKGAAGQAREPKRDGEKTNSFFFSQKNELPAGKRRDLLNNRIWVRMRLFFSARRAVVYDSRHS